MESNRPTTSNAAEVDDHCEPKCIIGEAASGNSVNRHGEAHESSSETAQQPEHAISRSAETERYISPEPNAADPAQEREPRDDESESEPEIMAQQDDESNFNALVDEFYPVDAFYPTPVPPRRLIASEREVQREKTEKAQRSAEAAQRPLMPDSGMRYSLKGQWERVTFSELLRTRLEPKGRKRTDFHPRPSHLKAGQGVDEQAGDHNNHSPSNAASPSGQALPLTWEDAQAFNAGTNIWDDADEDEWTLPTSVVPTGVSDLRRASGARVESEEEGELQDEDADNACAEKSDTADHDTSEDRNGCPDEPTSPQSAHELEYVSGMSLESGPRQLELLYKEACNSDILKNPQMALEMKRQAFEYVEAPNKDKMQSIGPATTDMSIKVRALWGLAAAHHYRHERNRLRDLYSPLDVNHKQLWADFHRQADQLQERELEYCELRNRSMGAEDELKRLNERLAHVENELTQSSIACEELQDSCKTLRQYMIRIKDWEDYQESTGTQTDLPDPVPAPQHTQQVSAGTQTTDLGSQQPVDQPSNVEITDLADQEGHLVDRIFDAAIGEGEEEEERPTRWDEEVCRSLGMLQFMPPQYVYWTTQLPPPPSAYQVGSVPYTKEDIPKDPLTGKPWPPSHAACHRALRQTESWKQDYNALMNQ